jgi:hypothetical protein
MVLTPLNDGVDVKDSAALHAGSLLERAGIRFAHPQFSGRVSAGQGLAQVINPT